MDMPTEKLARGELIEVCMRLKDENGLLLVEKEAKEELTEAVEFLESVSEPPSLAADVNVEKDLIGSWTLISTTSTSTPGIDRSKLPAFLLSDPLERLRENVRQASNKYVTVEQVVKSTTAAGVIDRVDHVISYRPPKKLQDLIDDLPDAITSLDINPLDVSQSKLILIHKASILKSDGTMKTKDTYEDTAGDDGNLSALKMKLTLSSVVLNVAGTSTVLEPDGKDLIGINLPFAGFVADSELLNSSPAGKFGIFETTYLDDDLRISRSRSPTGFDQVRVFVRSDSKLLDPDAEGEAVAVEAELMDGGSAEEDTHEGQDDVAPSDY